jgi:hypothetical protein
MSKLISWHNYQDFRYKLAEYKDLLINHEPKHDLRDSDVNKILEPFSPYFNVGTKKNNHGILYRDIEVLKSSWNIIDEPLTVEKYFLLKPLTMETKNIVDSILTLAISEPSSFKLDEDDQAKYDALPGGKLTFYLHVARKLLSDGYMTNNYYEL